MKLWLAAAKIGGLTYTPIYENGLVDSNFNYLGAFSYSKGKAKNLSSNTLFSANGNLLHGDFRGAYAYENIKLPTESYDRAFKANTAQQRQALEALQGADARTLAAGVGKVGALGTASNEKQRLQF